MGNGVLSSSGKHECISQNAIRSTLSQQQSDKYQGIISALCCDRNGRLTITVQNFQRINCITHVV